MIRLESEQSVFTNLEMFLNCDLKINVLAPYPLVDVCQNLERLAPRAHQDQDCPISFRAFV